MGLLAAVVFKLAETLVKFAIENGTGSKAAGEMGAGATGVLGGRAAGEIDGRRARRAVEQLVPRLEARISDRYLVEFRHVSDHDKAAVVEAVADTFEAVGGVGAGLVARADMDPVRLEQLLRQRAAEVLQSAALGQDGEQLFRVLLRDACGEVVRLVSALPEFESAFQAEALGRLSKLDSSLEQTSAVLSQFFDMQKAGFGRESIKDRLTRLPPVHRDRIERWWAEAPEPVEEIVAAFVGDEEEPLELVRQWVQTPPSRLFSGPVAARLTAATLIAAYGGSDLATRLFVSVAEDGAPRRHYWAARAAMLRLAEDRADEAARLLTEFVGTATTNDPLARTLVALFADDLHGMREALATWSPVEELDLVLHFALASDEVVRRHGGGDVTREMLDELIALSGRIVEHRWIAAVAQEHARYLVLRVERAEAEYRHADLAKARAWALRVRDERRAWRGDSAAAAAIACHAADAANDHRAVLVVGVQGQGGATAVEAASPRVRQLVLLARTWLGEAVDLVSADDVGDRSFAAALNALTVSSRGEDPSGYWREAAQTASDDGQLARALLGLARCGQRDQRLLDELADRMPSLAREIQAAADLAEGNTARGVATLRVLARKSQSAASILAGAYSSNGDIDGLIGVLLQAAEDFADPQLRLEAAYELNKAGRVEQAEEELTSLLAEAPPAWPGLHDAQVFAAQLAANAGRTERAITLLRSALSSKPENAAARWALINLLMIRAEPDAAWRVYQAGRDDLEPSDARLALLWIALHRQFGDRVETARGCLRLIRQYSDHEEVVGRALAALIAPVGSAGPLPQDLAEAIQQEARAFCLRWPQSTYLRKIDASDVARLVEVLNAESRPTPEARRFQRQIELGAVLGRQPIGVLAAAAQATYTEVVLRGATGVIPAAHPNPGEGDRCRVTASDVVGRAVVIDTTALVVLDALSPAVRDQALGLFGRVMTTDPVLHDARAAEELLSHRSGGRWVWDDASQSGRYVENPPEVADRLAEASRRLVETIEGLVRRPRPTTRVTGDLDDRRFTPWLSVLDLAAVEGAPLWVDDVALRSIARDVGLRTISTPAVLDVLVDLGLLDARERAEATARMFRAGIGDFEVGDWLYLESARIENWEPGGAASVALGRPAAWHHPETALRRARVLLDAVQRHRPDRLHAWLYWCVRGAAYAHFTNPRGACGVAASLLALTANLAHAQGTAVREQVQACRAALADVFRDFEIVADPLPVAAGLLFRAYLDEVPGIEAAQ